MVTLLSVGVGLGSLCLGLGFWLGLRMRDTRNLGVPAASGVLIRRPTSRNRPKAIDDQKAWEMEQEKN